MPKHAGRNDRNHTPIVHHLKSLGYSVQSLSSVGGGCPDIMVATFLYFNGRHIPTNLIFEIKVEEATIKRIKKKLENPIVQSTDSVQIAWHKTWTGQKALVSSVGEILTILKAYERGSPWLC